MQKTNISIMECTTSCYFGWSNSYLKCDRSISKKLKRCLVGCV